jgi:hypothetical protein
LEGGIAERCGAARLGGDGGEENFSVKRDRERERESGEPEMCGFGVFCFIFNFILV